jgi:hypothetical protein
MRSLVGMVVVVAAASAGCGAIIGLDSYSEDAGADDSSVSTHPLQGDDGTASGDDDEASEDGSSGEDVSNGDDSAEIAETGPVDSGSFDAGRDGPPACSPSTCSGCCSNGTCVGGASTGTCGTGGGACKSCAGSTPTCSNGACVAAPVEAGPPPPMCTVSSCKNTCIPFYQTNCCKSDGTCGCEVSFSNNCQ